jgi:RNA polymerase sigma-70 factor (ECF subfamily)
MVPDDETLIAASRSGDRTALAELLRRHKPAVERELTTNLQHEWNGLLTLEDVLQHSFAEICLHAANLPPAGAFPTWFRQLAVHNLRDAQRALLADKRGGRAKRVSLDGATFVSRVLGVEATLTSPVEQALRADADTVLARAIAQLPEDYALAIRLYDLSGEPIESVARRLNRSAGAVHLLRRRALLRLRELLQEKSTVLRHLA